MHILDELILSTVLPFFTVLALVLTIWSARKKKRRARMIVFGLCFLVLSAAYFVYTQMDFWRPGACEDAGGRYDYEAKKCNFRYSLLFEDDVFSVSV